MFVVRGQYESELTTSPLAFVEICHQVSRLTLFLTNRHEPSAKQTLTPPGCWLVAGTVQAESVLQPSPHDVGPPNRHPLKIPSLGVWTALYIVAPGMPKTHRQPR